MIFDPKTRQIFILGRYLERGLRDRAQNIKVLLIYYIEICTYTLFMFGFRSEDIISMEICLKSEFVKICLKNNVESPVLYTVALYSPSVLYTHDFRPKNREW